MYKMTGVRKNGSIVDKIYEDLNIAQFEFELTQIVAQNLSLTDENNRIIKEYEEVKPVVKYIVASEFCKRTFAYKKFAYNLFRLWKEKYDWVTLYEESQDGEKIIDCYIKGV